MTLLPYFQQLGDTVLARWKECDFAPAAFADLAARTLAAAPPAHHVTPDDIVRWVRRSDAIGPQRNLDATFGQPPVTLYHDERFYIEALFWLSSTTSIHQHAFAGAFSVLAGSSVQTRYDFRLRTQLERRLRLGDIALRDVKILRAGDVEPIELDGALIHSVFHLEHPSVTIVVRTGTPITDEPQFAYYPPCVAFDALDRDPHTIRRLQVLQLLRETAPADHEAAVREAIATWPPYAAFRVLDGAALRDDDPARLEELLGLACARFGPELGCLRDAFARRRRELIASSRRARVSDPELRLFLALLLVLPDREAVYAAIADAVPGADPRAQAIAWAHRLSGTDVVGIAFDEVNAILFECLLDGEGLAGALHRLREAYDDESVDAQRGELAAHYAELAASEVFQPLFRTRGGSAADRRRIGGGSAADPR